MKTSQDITANNNVRLLLDGRETLEAIKHALKNARQCINLEYFLISDDTTGNAIKDILIERAGAGVSVRILFDAVGSWRLGRGFVDELVSAGVHVRRFMPVTLRNLGRVIHRDHRKIITIDGRLGLLGGFNIGDIYLSQWRDTHIMLEGDAVRTLDKIFADMWAKSGGDALCMRSHSINKYREHSLECEEASIQNILSSGNVETLNLQITHKTDQKAHASNIWTKSGGEAVVVPVKILASGTGRSFRAIADEYVRIISRANSRVWITTPYLVPDKIFINALSGAAARGADVKIIIPSKSNHTLASWASQSYINELLTRGVRVFVYRDRFIHAKTFTADSYVAAVGTANIDALSFGTNYEVQAFVYSKHIVKELEDVFRDDLMHCTEETIINRKARPLIQRLKEKTGRLLSRWL